MFPHDDDPCPPPNAIRLSLTHTHIHTRAPGNTDRDGSRLNTFARPGDLASANPRDRPGEYWHVDGSQNALPQVYATISAAHHETAKCGSSRTLFASGVKAFNLLSPEMQKRAESLGVRYSKRLKPTNLRSGIQDSYASQAASASAVVRLRHHDQNAGYEYLVNPLVRTHPILGTKSIWVSPGDMECLEPLVEGDGEPLSPEESHELLRKFFMPGTVDGLVYEHTYELGDYVIWDNRQMIHSTAAYDYDDGARHLHHVSLKGPPCQQNDIPIRVGKVVATAEDIQKVWWSSSDKKSETSSSSSGYTPAGEVGVMTFQRPDQWAEKAH